MAESRIGADDGSTLPFTAVATTTCSIARTAEIIGQPWMLVVLRDLAHGVSRFDHLITHIGIAPAVLSRRLRTLVDAGLVDRVAYREVGHRTRHEYVLTTTGRQLGQILLAAKTFGDEHLAGAAGPPVHAEHAGCGGTVTSRAVCSHGHVLTAGDRVDERVGPGALLPGS
ncbi:winged helix-turn-helix transcriptional regulator [Pseudonocardia sp. GCM10023141]|uniref:winged helix-turn-helix transcriptional regulator n=1 Tax=Pseudonocardia sp. GCM10023141 TaxID=3252653 RepID=UPI00361920F0